MESRTRGKSDFTARDRSNFPVSQFIREFSVPPLYSPGGGFEFPAVNSMKKLDVIAGHEGMAQKGRKDYQNSGNSCSVTNL